MESMFQFQRSPGEKEEHMTKNDKVGVGWVAAAVNFTNAIVGSGICGLPFAMKEAGPFAAVLMMLGAGFLTDYSSRLLITLGDAHSSQDYKTLCDRLLGPAGGAAANLAAMSFAYGAMVSYQIIIGDTLAPVLFSLTGWSIFAQRRVVILLFISAVGFPLGAQRDMGVLASFSALSVAASTSLVLLVTFRGGAAAEQLSALVVADNSPGAHERGNKGGMVVAFGTVA
eukprot:Hpha_TRINITY_DN9553_c0_g2::TRINITY_DN9553_c0_g2_i1::g.115003::m.115003/K14997/SLC38A11; solute carrier family 38 (sodium-coupled neutral amino acid transporter), member 11